MAFEIDFLAEFDDESIIAELKRVAAELGKQNISVIELAEYGRVHYHTVVKRFGSMRHALNAAGLKPSRFTKATDEELLQQVANLWTQTLRDKGRSPTVSDAAEYKMPVAVTTVVHRFGSWKNALRRVAEASAEREFDGLPQTPSQRKPLALGKRFMVLKRDLYRCRVCRRSGVELEVDHILPVIRGGSDRMDNLQTLCRDCNRGKGAQMQ